MERNVGGRDRTVRIVLGVALTAASMATVAFGDALGQSTQFVVAGGALLAAAVLLGTAGARTCPLNSLFGRDTADDSDR
ncbi:MAG: DUF2892 domain-containing protein [Haloferacaceae archaeon]